MYQYPIKPFGRRHYTYYKELKIKVKIQFKLEDIRIIYLKSLRQVSLPFVIGLLETPARIIKDPLCSI